MSGTSLKSDQLVVFNLGYTLESCREKFFLNLDARALPHTIESESMRVGPLPQYFLNSLGVSNV